MTDGLTASDVAVLTGNNGRNDGFGGDWGAWIVFFLIFAMCGWGGYGGFGSWGGNGGGANSPGFQGWATRADINESFMLNDIQGGIRGIERGVYDSSYHIVNGMNTGFSNAELQRCNQQAALMQQLNNMSFQSQQCCCDTLGAIKDTRYDIAKMGCDVIQNAHSDTDRIIARLDAMEATRQQERIHALELDNQKLAFQASQTAQNSYLAAMSDAQTAELIRRINPQAVPAYVVPNPNVYACGCNTACGC